MFSKRAKCPFLFSDGVFQVNVETHELPIIPIPERFAGTLGIINNSLEGGFGLSQQSVTSGTIHLC